MVNMIIDFFFPEIDYYISFLITFIGVQVLLRLTFSCYIYFVASVSHGKDQAPVVQRLDNAIHRINYYPVDSVVCFVNTYPLNSDLSAG